MSNLHKNALQAAVRMSMMALRDIANRGDCDYVLDDENRTDPCSCAVCTARDVLEMIDEGAGNWRYKGRGADRVRTMPRERKMLDAWRDQVDDKLLGLIINADPDGHERGVEQPTVQDWYVATSVVQWLGTNVGMEVLRKAGWEYKDFAADQVERERRHLPADGGGGDDIK